MLMPLPLIVVGIFLGIMFEVKFVYNNFNIKKNSAG